jgi:hypothetical protein
MRGSMKKYVDIIGSILMAVLFVVVVYIFWVVTDM